MSQVCDVQTDINPAGFVPWAQRQPNLLAEVGGANNAVVSTLMDSFGNLVPVKLGLRITLFLTHTLQAGANTFALNGVTKSIKGHRNPANNIGTAYAAGGAIDLLYDGTQWQDMSQ